MTLAISLLAGAVVLALLLVAARVARTLPPKETWVCRLCETGFSSKAAGEEHLLNQHGQH